MRLYQIDLSSCEFEIESRVFDDIQGWIVYAETKEGRELTEDELDSLNDDYDTHEFIADRVISREI